MKKLLSLLLILLSLFTVIYAQDNSPWKNVSNKTVSNVYIGLGRHEYSLSGGQGFNVYLKNSGTTTVTVSGKLVATTVCGNYVSTYFSTVLKPGQESSGGNLGTSTNSQSGVVTEGDCSGVRYSPNYSSKYINRIKTLNVENLQIQPLGTGGTDVLSPVVANIPTNNTNVQVLKAQNADLQSQVDDLKRQKAALALSRDSIAMALEQERNKKIQAVEVAKANAIAFKPNSQNELVYVSDYSKDGEIKVMADNINTPLLVLKHKVYVLNSACFTTNKKAINAPNPRYDAYMSTHATDVNTVNLQTLYYKCNIDDRGHLILYIPATLSKKKARIYLTDHFVAKNKYEIKYL